MFLLRIKYGEQGISWYDDGDNDDDVNLELLAIQQFFISSVLLSLMYVPITIVIINIIVFGVFWCCCFNISFLDQVEMKQFGRKHGGIRNYFETWQSVPESLCWKGRKDNQINLHHIKIKLIIYREEFDSILHTPPITTTVAMSFPSQLASSNSFFTALVSKKKNILRLFFLAITLGVGKS